jgi:hypothetical protein
MKVLPGQKLRIPARDFNAMLDAAEAQRRAMADLAALAARRLPETMLARNTSEDDLPVGAVVGISGHWQTDPRWDRLLEVRVVTSDDIGRWAVCAEPIKAGKVGRVYTHGVCAVLLRNTTEAPATAAEAVSGEQYLDAGSGSAQILWEADYEGEEVHVALARFPFSGAIVAEEIVTYREQITYQGTGGTAFGTIYALAQPFDLRAVKCAWARPSAAVPNDSGDLNCDPESLAHGSLLLLNQAEEEVARCYHHAASCTPGGGSSILPNTYPQVITMADGVPGVTDTIVRKVQGAVYGASLNEPPQSIEAAFGLPQVTELCRAP